MDTVANALRSIAEGSETAITVTKDLAPTGDAKASRLEIVHSFTPPPAPVRCESPARAHDFHDAGSLIAYVKKYGGKNTVIVADAEAREVAVVLDEAAEKGRETIRLKPIINPSFKPWAEAFGGFVEIARFADFLMRNRKTIVEPNGRDLAMDMAQVRASVRYTVDRGLGKKAINAIICETDVQGTANKSTVELADSLKIRVPLFVGSSPRVLEVDILVDVDPDSKAVGARITCPDLANAYMEEFTSMIGRIEQETKALVTLGRLDYEPWEYLPVPDTDSRLDHTDRDDRSRDYRDRNNR